MGPLIIICVALLFFTDTAAAQTNPVKEIAPGVYFYRGDELQRKPANCTWIVFKDYVLIVDANYPWGAEEILKEISKTTTKPVKFVFNTHYHHDHTFGNSIFAGSGATIVSTQKTAEEMRTLGEHEWNHGSDYSGRSMKGYKREFPSLVFNERLIFNDGTQRVELINMGQAHTAGDGVAYLPKQKILITGDLFVNGNPWGNNVADQHADYNKWLAVLDTLSTWDINIVIPGHGEPGTTKSLKNQSAYLKDMMDQVRKGIEEGKTKEQLIREIKLDKHPVYGKNKISIERSAGDMYDKYKKQSLIQE